jgi:hypothetical protein
MISVLVISLSLLLSLIPIFSCARNRRQADKNNAPGDLAARIANGHATAPPCSAMTPRWFTRACHPEVGDSLLVKLGTVHAHWNASATAKLVFTEFILLDEGQRSAVFVEPASALHQCMYHRPQAMVPAHAHTHPALTAHICLPGKRLACLTQAAS